MPSSASWEEQIAAGLETVSHLQFSWDHAADEYGQTTLNDRYFMVLSR